MFCINERSRSAELLRFRDHMQGDRRLTGRFRAIDLDDPAARDSAYTKCKVKLQAPGRDRGNADLRSGIAQLHYGALTKLFFDLA